MAAGPVGTTVVFHSFTGFQPPLFPVLLGGGVPLWVRDRLGEWRLVNRGALQACSLQAGQGASGQKAAFRTLTITTAGAVC